MNKQQIIEMILENGTVHQQYIVRRDILNISRKTEQMIDLQNSIMKSKQVINILKNQDQNGWIGFELHGSPGKAIDASIICLIEDYGVEPDCKEMQMAKMALLADLNPDPNKRISYNSGSGRIDNGHFYGIRNYNFSRAVVLGLLSQNFDQEEEVKNAFSEIFKIFKEGIDIKSLDDVSKLCTAKKYIGYRAYISERCFPWISDIIVLSSNLGWKTSVNEDIVTKCFKNIANLMPIPVIFEVVNGHYLAPICNYDYFSYSDCIDIPKGNIFWWLRDFSRLCKICRIEEIPFFYNQVLNLEKHIENDDFIEKLSSDALHSLEKWHGYRNKWKNEIECKIDIYFKVLRLMNNAKIKF